MPTYSYRCTECGNAFDVQQSFTDDSLTVCPRCKGVLRKVFSPVGVSFTGSGFYRNDSRAKPPGDTTTSGSESNAKATEKTSVKPAEKTSTKDSSSSSAPAKSTSSSSSSGSSKKSTE